MVIIYIYIYIVYGFIDIIVFLDQSIPIHRYRLQYKHYPVGHPTLIGPKLSGYITNDLEGVVRCEVLPPNNLYIPLLPCKFNEKLMFKRNVITRRSKEL